MHTWILLAVEAEDHDDATGAAESYLEDEGPGQLFDWYEVGGRWDTLLDGKSTLNAADNLERFEFWVNRAVSVQNSNYDGYRRQIAGQPITADEVNKFSMFPIGPDEVDGAAERVSQLNADMGARVQQLLTNTEPPSDFADHMAAYTLRKFAMMANDELTFDTHVWDTRNWTAQPGALLEDAKNPETAKTLWLVCMDLHN